MVIKESVRFQGDIKELISLAEQGSLEHNRMLGLEYILGEKIDESRDNAKKHFIFSAEKGDAKSHLNLALFYIHEENSLKVEEHLTIASDLGLIQAKIVLAHFYLRGVIEGKGIEDAIYFLEKRYPEINVDTQLLLAKLYLENRDKKCKIAFEKAAYMGSREAKLFLGNIHDDLLNYINIFSDEEVASEWYKEAAKEGCPEAQLYLGNMYSFGGAFLKQDDERAIYWLTLSSNAGIPMATYKLAKIYLSDPTATRKNKAIDLLKVAVQQGCIKSACELGDLYSRIYDSTGNYEKLKLAIEWYKCGYEHNQGEVAFNLGTLYNYDTPLHCDKKSFEWYLLAARYNIPKAMYLVAEHYLSGVAVEKDFIEAYAWLVLSDQSYLYDAKEKTDELIRELTEIELGKAIKRCLYIKEKYLLKSTFLIRDLYINITKNKNFYQNS